MTIINLLQSMETADASDLFLTVGKPPALRVRGMLKHMSESSISRRDFDTFLTENFPPDIAERLQAERDLDIGLSLSETERYRLNLFFQKGQVAMVARRVPSGALEFDALGLPDVICQLAEATRGLVLVTGATGSGKSTTMAAMLHHINRNFSRHIVTVEDPIEFIHQDCRSVVTQREVGTDTLSFTASLRHVVRQSPDVIFIGEMRDFDTVQTAISAAMTGHLVITTMHTIDTAQTVERVINYFPEHLRDQVATDFAMSLRGIVSQRLLPTDDGDRSVPAFEVLLGTSHVRRLIAERQFGDIEDALKAGAGVGMQTFTRALASLYQNGSISLEVGATAATNREEFLLVAQGMETGIDSLRQQHDDQESNELSMRSLLKAAIRHGASDLLVTLGKPPVLRINGALRELSTAPLNSTDTQKLLGSLLSAAQRDRFEAEREIDFSLSVTTVEREGTAEDGDGHRFRVNGFYQKGAAAAAIRVIPQVVPTPDSLGLPPVVLELAKRQHGLILVTGPTGHGKSTTLAAIIDQINRSRSCHIVTIEDPIEYVHTSVKAIIEQREVYADTKSFSSALKYVLRQDPDVILIGELRDEETMAAALTAAETGHLVLGTLHTNDAAQTVDRIIDSFSPHQQNQVRAQLAACLEAVIAQRLVPTLAGDSRVPAFEIMIGSPAVRALIRENKAHQLLAAIETAARDGMVTMDKALLTLYNAKQISEQTLKSLLHDRQIAVDLSRF